MDASWMGDGFSHPFSKIPIRSSPRRTKRHVKINVQAGRGRAEELTLEAEVLELVALRVRDVGGALASVARGQLQLVLPVRVLRRAAKEERA